MIKLIDDQLKTWGRWVVRSDSRGLGYPAVSPMFADTPSGNGFGSSPPPGVFSHAECVEEINRVVACLDKRERALCFEVYVVTGRNRAQVASDMGVNRDTLYAWLDALHVRVASCMRYQTAA